MTQLDEFQAEVARLALAAAAGHGFALAGGSALIAHGIVNRATEDVDLFTDQEGGVRAAAEPVAAALRAAGLQVEEIDDAGDLGDVFYGFDQDIVELEVCRGEQVARLQLARFDRGHRPVVMDVGPVLHRDDAVATKVAALATRAYPRDLIDVAASLDQYSRDELLDLARRADPGLGSEDFAEAMCRLDRLDDSVFGLYQRTPAQVAEIRARFADWPRA